MPGPPAERDRRATRSGRCTSTRRGRRGGLHRRPGLRSTPWTASGRTSSSGRCTSPAASAPGTRARPSAIAYELPNDTAYCETCAAIGLALWSHRLNLMHGDAQYADVLERALYNGILSGVGLDGEHFFYVNPLASGGKHHRQPFYRLRLLPDERGAASCPRCPATSTPRTATSIYVNLYAAGTGERVAGRSPRSRSRRRPATPGTAEVDTHGRAGQADRVRHPPADSRLVPTAQRCRSTASRIAPLAIEKGYAVRPARVEAGRHGRTRPAHARSSGSRPIRGSRPTAAAWPSSAGRSSTASRRSTTAARSAEHRPGPRSEVHRRASPGPARAA